VQVVLENIGNIVIMLILLSFSAFFSGSETAFFSLTARQLRQLKNSQNRLAHLAARLLSTPQRLLGSFLLSNLIVNIAYYSAASVITVNIGRTYGSAAGVASALTTFAAILLCGEMLPKYFAYTSNERIVVFSALPTSLLVRVLRPILTIVSFFVVEPFIRLIVHPSRKKSFIKRKELRFLIESSRQQGLISADESEFLGEVVDFSSLKVRQVMRPRVDMVACDVKLAPEACRRFLDKHDLTKVPVYSGTIENCIGTIHLRDILLTPDQPLKNLVRKPQFIPEQKTVESLLEFFRTSGTDSALVVDEFGGLAGWVRLEDVVQELVGPIDETVGVSPIEQLGPMRYRFAATMPIHDWSAAFGLDADEMRLSTIGGLVTALIGRIPRPGDVAHIRNLRFEVEKMHGHRIQTVVLTLEPIGKKHRKGAE
jgi:putative hemolysin